jgi:hypothetical protein
VELGENGSESKEDSAHRVFAVGALQPLKAASFKDQLDVPLDMAVLGILIQPRDSFRIVGKRGRYPVGFLEIARSSPLTA